MDERTAIKNAINAFKATIKAGDEIDEILCFVPRGNRVDWRTAAAELLNCIDYFESKPAAEHIASTFGGAEIPASKAQRKSTSGGQKRAAAKTRAPSRRVSRSKLSSGELTAPRGVIGSPEQQED
jgi:hypothetical protein